MSPRVAPLLAALLSLAATAPATAQTTGGTLDAVRDRLDGIATERLAPLAERATPEPDAPFPEGVAFTIRFTGDIQGLQAGAPVEILGLRVGTVRAVSIEYDPASGGFVAPVLIDIVPGRIAAGGRAPTTAQATRDLVALLIERGMRASVGSAGLLDRAALVTLEIDEDAAPVPPRSPTGTPEIPASPGAAAELRQALDDLLARIEALPLEQLASEALTTVREAREILTGPRMQEALAKLASAAGEVETAAAGLEGKTQAVFDRLGTAAGAAEQAAAQAGRTAQALQASVGPRAPIWGDLDRLLSETTGTVRALRLFVEYLERHPEALLTGKPE